MIQVPKYRIGYSWDMEKREEAKQSHRSDEEKPFPSNLIKKFIKFSEKILKLPPRIGGRRLFI